MGSTEQHGPHLPPDTDTRIATAVAYAAAKNLRAGGYPDELLLAAAIAYGASGEHEGFPGTVLKAPVMAQLSYPDPDQIPEPLAGMLAAMPSVAAIDMLAHSPVLAEHFLRLAQAQFTALELPERARELVILSVAAKGRCEFEYQQHIPISAAAGIEPALRQAIWDRTVDPASLPDAENVLIGFVTDVLNRPRVSARRFAAMQRFYPPRQIVEILQLIGFYWGLGRICTVLDIEVQTPTTLDAFEAVANLSA